MQKAFLQGCCALIAIILINGCSDSSIAGKYSKEGSSLTLTLSNNGAFNLSSGGVGTYSVRGAKISMVNTVCGAAHGAIKNNTLVFPSVSSDDMVGATFAGKWKKK